MTGLDSLQGVSERTFFESEYIQPKLQQFLIILRLKYLVKNAVITREIDTCAVDSRAGGSGRTPEHWSQDDSRDCPKYKINSMVSFLSCWVFFLLQSSIFHAVFLILMYMKAMLCPCIMYCKYVAYFILKGFTVNNLLLSEETLDCLTMVELLMTMGTFEVVMNALCFMGWSFFQAQKIMVCM